MQIYTVLPFPSRWSIIGICIPYIFLKQTIIIVMHVRELELTICSLVILVNFSLCFYCATLPEEIRHMSDEHPLTLYCGGKGNGKNWCDVCEVELDPSKWFFACFDCEVALHVQCALGDFSRLMPGKLYTFGERKREVVLNNLYTRPFCSHCRSRCKAPVIFKDNGEDNRYICSLSCLSSYLCIDFC